MALVRSREPRFFTDLPLHVHHTHAYEIDTESESLLGNKKRRRRGFLERIPAVALAVGTSACACFCVLMVVFAALGARRLNRAVAVIDASADLESTLTRSILNVDSLLNSSALIAKTAHELGLHGLDASIFARPFLTRILNTTTSIADDAHKLLVKPQINFG